MRQVHESPMPEDNNISATSGPTMRPSACMEKTNPTSRPPVMAVGVLTHEHGGDGIVTTDAQAQNEASDHQEEKARGQGRGNRPDNHDHGHRDVDLLPTDHIRDPTEDEGADESPENGRSGDPARLERAQVPLDGHECGHGPDNEQVVGVREESDTRDDHGAPMKLAGRRLVEKVHHGGTVLADRSERCQAEGGRERVIHRFCGEHAPLRRLG